MELWCPTSRSPSIAENARSGSVLAVPSEVWGEDMATANQSPKWKIDYLRADAEQFDKLVRVLEYYDTMRSAR
jgi:hypothetical protein